MVLGILLETFIPLSVPECSLWGWIYKAIQCSLRDHRLTVVHGMSSMANMAKVGRVALRALIYFEVLTIIARSCSCCGECC